MKTRMTRLLTMVLCAAMCVLCWPSAAFAFDPVDLTRTNTLKIFANDEEVPLAGVGFKLHLVAEINELAQYELLPAYAGFSGDINKLDKAADWAEAAQELRRLARNTQPDYAATSREDGMAVITGMKPGLYLVYGAPVEIEPWAYTFAPFLVSLPTRDMNDEWVYELFSDVKLEKMPARMDLDVVKIWDDQGHEANRPNEIYVELYCDGEKVDAVQLHAGNSWSHTFTNLAAAHEYSIKEQTVPKWYKVTYETVNGALVMINHHDGTTTPVPPIPSTGQLWWPVFVLAGAGMILCIVGWFIHRKWSQEHEE